MRSPRGDQCGLCFPIVFTEPPAREADYVAATGDKMPDAKNSSVQ